MSFDIGDVARLNETLQPLVKLGDDSILIGIYCQHIDRDELSVDAELRCVAGVICNLTCMQESLCWDATAVEACAADLVLFNKYY